MLEKTTFTNTHCAEKFFWDLILVNLMNPEFFLYCTSIIAVTSIIIISFKIKYMDLLALVSHIYNSFLSYLCSFLLICSCVFFSTPILQLAVKFTLKYRIASPYIALLFCFFFITPFSLNCNCSRYSFQPLSSIFCFYNLS